MAFTDAEKNQLVTILGIPLPDLNYQLGYYSLYITAQTETDVRAQITRWQTVGIDFVSIEPMDRNFGARINPGDAKSDVRQNIAILLGFNPADIGVSGQTTIVRG